MCGVRDLGFGPTTAANGVKEKVGTTRMEKWVHPARQAESDCGRRCSSILGLQESGLVATGTR